MHLAVGGGLGAVSALTTANASTVHPVLPLHNASPAPVRRRRVTCSRDCVRIRAIEGLVDALTTMAPHLPLAYEPVALPCSMMQCGDIVHRSTLDPVLRGEIIGPDWRTFALMATMGAYLFAPPGVLPGAFDYYVYAKLRNKTQTTYCKDDIILGRKLATGGFGTVFRGDLRLESGELVPVIVKKAKEFGEAEAWMNERMTRIGGDHCAEYVTAFDETDSSDGKKKEVKKPSNARGKPASPLDDAVWLIWKYEGDNTLWNLMESKEFPYNMEPLLFGRELRLPRGALRKAVTIRLVMKQLLEALAAAHSTGIVHRDIKPQNCIVSERDRKIKLIDLGAAADLRVGINYVPAEYLLDPRYAPPQQYVMSTQTPKPPPAPVAAFLSPVLWRMENPDRFDMYSCGVTFLQMVFPSLRNDNSIINFRKRLEVLKWDLRAWRAEEEARKGGPKAEVAEGFELLDMDGGTGWELLCSLMAFKPADRPAAAEAVLCPFLSVAGASSGVSAVASTSQTLLSQAGKAVSRTLDNQLFADFASAATGEGRGALTEAQLRQELGLEEEAPKAPLTASNTIVWWKERQNELRKSIQKREGSQSTRPEGLPVAGNSGSARVSKAAGGGSARVSKAAAGGRAGSPVAGNNNGTANNGNGKVRARSPSLVALFGGLGGSASSKKDGTTAIRALDSDESSEEEEEEKEVVMVGQRGGGSKRISAARESSPGFGILDMLRRK